jgi:hypothetical protein
LDKYNTDPKYRTYTFYIFCCRGFNKLRNMHILKLYWISSNDVFSYLFIVLYFDLDGTCSHYSPHYVLLDKPWFPQFLNLPHKVTFVLRISSTPQSKGFFLTKPNIQFHQRIGTCSIKKLLNNNFDSQNILRIQYCL